MGLTSLFGMGRGGHHRNSHHKWDFGHIKRGRKHKGRIILKIGL
jgi:hypothetical protein